jgi:hypothetical protein
VILDPQLRLQRDPEDSRPVEGERIRMVATGRPLGSRIQSPPPPYDSGREHHDFQQRTSRESSSDDDNDDWVCFAEVLPSREGAGSAAEGNRKLEGDAETSSPYDLAKSQLKEAQAKLVAQSIDANEKLVRVHQYYEHKLEMAISPSAPDGQSHHGPE